MMLPKRPLKRLGQLLHLPQRLQPQLRQPQQRLPLWHREKHLDPRQLQRRQPGLGPLPRPPQAQAYSSPSPRFGDGPASLPQAVGCRAKFLRPSPLGRLHRVPGPTPSLDSRGGSSLTTPEGETITVTYGLWIVDVETGDITPSDHPDRRRKHRLIQAALVWLFPIAAKFLGPQIFLTQFQGGSCRII